MAGKRTPRYLLAVVGILALTSAACGGGGSGSGGGGKSGALTLWHGYTEVEVKSFQHIVDTCTASTGIKVKPLFVNNDKALEKLTVALQGDHPPDITYQFGSSLPQLAEAPGIVDLTDWVKSPGLKWDDFIAGARTAATVDGKVLGVPALIDNLAVVYNKKLFDEAGVAYPTANWTWNDFRAAAKALTNPGKKQFGFSYPADATEDTVWHYVPLLWQNGGAILSKDGRTVAFDSTEGVEALQVLTDMAVKDKSVYIDIQNSQYTGLFNSNKIGMLVTGPWDLASFPDVTYGVETLPGFNGDHQTIAGPDMWSLFDNGRVDQAKKFVACLTAPAQLKTDALAAGHLPLRSSVIDDAAFVKQLDAKVPGTGVFAKNLENVKQARPVIATYPQISEALGRAIVEALLGQKDPKAALDGAAKEANDALSAAR